MKSSDNTKYSSLIAFLAVVVTLSSFRDDFSKVPINLIFQTDLFTLGAFFAGLMILAAYVYSFAESVSNLGARYSRLSAIIFRTANVVHLFAMFFPVLVIVTTLITLLFVAILPTIDREIANTSISIAAAMFGGVNAFILGRRISLAKVAKSSATYIELSLNDLEAAGKHLQNKDYYRYIELVYSAFYFAAKANLIKKGYSPEGLDNDKLDEFIMRERLLTKDQLKKLRTIRAIYLSGDKDLALKNVKSFTELSRKLLNSIYANV